MKKKFTSSDAMPQPVAKWPHALLLSMGIIGIHAQAMAQTFITTNQKDPINVKTNEIVNVGPNVDLSVPGYWVYGQNGTSWWANPETVVVNVNDGSFVMEKGNINGNLKNDRATDGILMQRGSVRLTGVNVVVDHATGDALQMEGRSSAMLTNSTLLAEGASGHAVLMQSVNPAWNNTVTVNGGSLTSDKAEAIYVQDNNSIVNLDNVKVSGTKAIYVKDGNFRSHELNVKRSTLTGTNGSALHIDSDSSVVNLLDTTASSTDGANSAVVLNGDGNTLNMQGGEFKVTGAGNRNVAALNLTSKGGTADISHAKLTATGDRAMGIIVSRGNIKLDEVAISTTGKDAHGVSNTGAVVTLDVTGGSIATKGESSNGLNINSGLSATAKGTRIDIAGNSSSGVVVNNNAAIDIRDSKVNMTNAVSDSGALVVNGANAKLKATNVDVAAIGNVSGLVITNGAGEFSGGSISTANGAGVILADRANVLIDDSARIQTAGGAGVAASNGSKVTISNNVSVQTTGGDGVVVSGGDAVIDNGVCIQTTGGTGVIGSDGSGILISNGTSIHATDGDGVVVSGGGDAVIDNKVSIEATGGSGVIGSGGSAVMISNGTSIHATDGDGVVVSGGGDIVIDNKVSIEATGGSGVIGSGGSAVMISNGASIHATDGDGVAVSGGGDIVIDNGVSIQATGGTGVIGSDGSNVMISNGSSVHAMAGAGVVVSNGSNAMISNGVSIQTTDGAGLVASEGASVVIDNGTSIRTTGTEAHAVHLFGEPLQTVMIDGATLATDNAQADLIRVEGGVADITVKNGAVINTDGNILNLQSSAGVASTVKFVADGIGMTGNILSDSASTSDVTLRNGAALTGRIDSSALHVDGSSTWNIGGNSELTAFTLNGGAVNYRQPDGGVFTTVRTGSLEGSGGRILMHTPFGDGTDPADFLHVTGDSTGSNVLAVKKTGGVGAQTIGDGIHLVQIDGNSAADNFSLEDGILHAGLYEYFLKQGGQTRANDWYLKSTRRAALPAYLMAPTLNREFGYTTIGTMRERTGDLGNIVRSEKGDSSDHSVWGRIGGSHLRTGSLEQIGANSRSSYMQFGKDWTIASDPTGASTHAGVTMTLGEMHASFTDDKRIAAGAPLGRDTGTAKSRAAGVGAYWTKHYANGAYLDTVGQVTRYGTQYKDARALEASTKAIGAAVSVEAGKPIASYGSLRVEAQGQLIYQYLRTDKFTDELSAIAANSNSALRGRVGVRLFQEMENGDTPRAATPYATFNVYRNFKGAASVGIDGQSMQTQTNKTSGEIGVGITGRPSKQGMLYAGLKYRHQLGGSQFEGAAGEIGYRFSW